MPRLVRDVVEVKDCSSLDQLILSLIEVRESIPAATEADVKMRGCDVFGRRISISFMRPQTAEEAECDARYANAYRESRERELSKLQEELGVECHVPRHRRHGQLRIVA